MENRHEIVSGGDGSVTDRAEPPTTRIFFWQRQFGLRSTLGQKVFDVMAGAILPIVCVWCDPIVFTGAEPPGIGSPFSAYAVGGYLFIFLEILVLLLYLLLGRRLGVLRGFLGGMLAAGAVSACLLGLAILPLTVIGLFLLIGFLGLSPFLTSFVFGRNALRALHGGDRQGHPGVRWIVAILGAALALGAPLAAQREINQLVSHLSQAESGERPEQRATEIECARCVTRWVGIGSVDRLVDAYDQETDPAAKQRLADVYHEITGRDIESRLARLRD